MEQISKAREGMPQFLLFVLFLLCSMATAKTRKFYFKIQYFEITKLCSTKSIVTVNGKFPGPIIQVEEGDKLLIKVENTVDENVTLHWHGVRQLRNGWADGPSYVTQCPIQNGQSYIYNFTITHQVGTLWWHAHIQWLRATMYGAFIILPKAGQLYPFHLPDSEVAILLGQWWKSDVDAVLQEALNSGAAANVSDALTINGNPGQLYQCSQEDVFILEVDAHKTYLLRIVNAALNNDLFFGIAGHDLKVVAVDATYVKPFVTDYIVVTPGQTTDVLIITDQPTGSYYMGAHAYVSAPVPVDNSTTIAILRYKNAPFSQPPSMPILPTFTDTDSVFKFGSQLRSLYPNEYPSLPKIVEKQLFITIGLAIEDCPKEALPQTCRAGLRNGRFAASMNNISFIKPDIAILEAFYYHIPGVYTSDFPQKPHFAFNYTGPPPNNTNSMSGTRAAVIPFGTNVQIILQGTSSVTSESHPIHLHGYDFYVVGQGFGNFDSLKKLSFNLIDPPKRNTIGVPVNGWAAIRFKADNPGAWFIHCHLDLHTVWGLDSVLIVENGNGPMQSMQPPPVDLPKC